MEEDVYDKLDDMRQGTHEALGTYTARFKDCVTTFGAIGLESPVESEMLRKYRKSLDKSRYSKLLEELNLDVACTCVPFCTPKAMCIEPKAISVVILVLGSISSYCSCYCTGKVRDIKTCRFCQF